MRELSGKSVDVAKRIDVLCHARHMKPEEVFDVVAIWVAISLHMETLETLINRAEELKEQVL